MDNLREPEPLMVSSMLDLMILLVVSFTGIVINWKHLRNMNEDDKMRPPGTSECLIKDVLNTYTKVGMVGFPFHFFLNWFLNERYVLPAWFQYVLCYDQYVVNTFRWYYSFNSLVISTMRYTYIVQNKAVLRFGKEKAKAMFYYGSILIPILLAVLNAVSVQTPVHVLNVAATICVDFYLNSLNVTIEDANSIPGFGSPILMFVHQYISVDITHYVQVFLTVVAVVVLSNVIEGILYWKTFRVIRR